MDGARPRIDVVGSVNTIRLRLKAYFSLQMLQCGMCQF